MDAGCAAAFASKSDRRTAAPTGISSFGFLLVFPADNWPLLRNLF